MAYGKMGSGKKVNQGMGKSSRPDMSKMRKHPSESIADQTSAVGNKPVKQAMQYQGATTMNYGKLGNITHHDGEAVADKMTAKGKAPVKGRHNPGMTY